LGGFLRIDCAAVALDIHHTAGWILVAVCKSTSKIDDATLPIKLIVQEVA
jgi:hypothetical protein